MTRLAFLLAAVIAGWAISLPLQVESYVLSPLQVCAVYTPFVIATGISAWKWRAPLGATALLTALCVMILKLATEPLQAVLGQWSLTFVAVPGAWAPAFLTLMVSMASTLHPMFSKLRPASVAAGATLGWWFHHTFADFIYYENDTFPPFVSVAIPFVAIMALTPVQGRDTWVSRTYASLEPLLVVVIGWLASVPFYKRHSLYMRLPDLQRHISIVAVPCVLMAIGLALTNLLRQRRGSPPNPAAPADQKAPLPGR